MANISLESLTKVSLNSVAPDFIRLNGKQIWQKQTDDEQFNYVGLDANGYMEGQVAYDGTPVAYAIGKPNYEYYQQVSPTPSTLTEYYGKYIYASTLGGETFIEITSTNISSYEGQITVGETPCYLLVDAKEDADADEISTFADCGGYSSEYYGGYDFQTPQDHISEFIVPEILVLPDTYKGKPVTRILENAFKGEYVTDNSRDEWQALNIKEIQFGQNIEVLDTDSFYNLGVSNSIVLPNSMKKIEGTAFYGCGTPSMQLEIPASVEEVTGSVCYGWSGSKLIFGNPTIIKGNFDCKTGTTIVLKETVKNITGDVFSGNYIPSVYVFEHSEDAEITLDITSLKSAKAITIYTDNTIVKNYDWSGKNIIVTFKALSEYTG